MAHVNVIAHRGASHARPENTIPAFQHAIDLGVDMLEFDVRLTADGHAVIMHDTSVKRTTDGEGAIGKMTLEQVRELDAGLPFHEKYRGTKVPTLDESLEFAKASGVGIDVQLYATDDSAEPLARTAVEALQRHGFDERAFIAGEENVVLLVRGFDPSRPICNLTGQRDETSLEYIHDMGSSIVQAFARYVTTAYVDRAHELGIIVNVFYADHANEMKRLIDCGIDGILTNEPETLLRVLGRDATSE